MDALHKRLTDYTKSNMLSKAVKCGSERGVAVLNKYYGKTNESALYRAALCEFMTLISRSTVQWFE
jgi:hypothetical protein